MLLLKYLLLVTAAAMLAAAASILLYDLYARLRRLPGPPPPSPEGDATTPPAAVEAMPAVRWSLALRLAVLAWLPLLAGFSIVVVPAGYGGVRVSQLSGTRPGTLYPGTHLVKPMLERVALYDIRDQVFTTTGADKDGVPEAPAKQKAAGAPAAEVFRVHAREGLGIGLSITVRYRLDPRRLDHLHANLPQPVQRELVPPVVASVFRQYVPRYTVREVFSTRREEINSLAAQAITEKLGADGILVKEVMLRDIQLPAEYAKGLEGLLLKEQENESLTYETEIQRKQVRIAELQAEAQKARQVKAAEADAQTRVLHAKGESDAMKYLLPLKEKQIHQTRLEAEARKEATVKNAEAAAEAKVIDSRAELERRRLMAEAEGNRIRVTAAADAERMQAEAVVLKQNPLLINKIVAERLSDKIQIMMVPSDGRFFFNDFMRNLGSGTATADAARDAHADDAAGARKAAARRDSFR